MLVVRRRRAKIRTLQNLDLQPGRYKITAYLRGLDIGAGIWNNNTEFMFADKYFSLKKDGTFGWTKLTYVADLAEETGRPVVRTLGARLLLDRRRFAGQGRQRRSPHCGTGAGQGGSADNTAR